MAFAKTMAIEVDAATGNDNNGGGFDSVSGVPGTNYAWGAGQTAIAYTDPTLATGTTLSSVIRAFVAADVGNIINLRTVGSGTGTTGRYQILSVTAGVATLDRSAGTSGAVFSAATLGGSLATIQIGIDTAFKNAGAVADCRLYVKKGTYNGTVTLNTTSGVSLSSGISRMCSYNTAHDDNPTIQSGNQASYGAAATGAGGVVCFTMSMSGFQVHNFTFIGTSTGGTKATAGITGGSTLDVVTQCRVYDTSSYGIIIASTGMICFCEANATGTQGLAGSAPSEYSYNWSHKISGAAVYGIVCTTWCKAHCNLVTNIGTSGNSQGILLQDYGTAAHGNTIWGAFQIALAGTAGQWWTLLQLSTNNLLCKSAYGIGSTGSVPFTGAFSVTTDYNGFYGNSTNNYANYVAGAHDVAMSATPFNGSDSNNSAETSADWTLNNNNPGGAQARGAGTFGVAPNAAGTGARDIGCFQHQDSASSGGTRPALVVNGAGPSSFVR